MSNDIVKQVVDRDFVMDVCIDVESHFGAWDCVHPEDICIAAIRRYMKQSCLHCYGNGGFGSGYESGLAAKDASVMCGWCDGTGKNKWC